MPTWITQDDLLASRHVRGLSDTDAVVETFDALEPRIERFHRKAWAPREHSEQLRGDGSDHVWLTRMPARDLVDVTIDGVAQDVGDFVVWTSGRLERRGNRRFAYGSRIDVTYNHGEDAPPVDLLDAALRACATLASHHTNPRVGERTETIETPTGWTINFAALPDWERGRPLGMPDVDLVVNSYAGEGRPTIA